VYHLPLLVSQENFFGWTPSHSGGLFWNLLGPQLVCSGTGHMPPFEIRSVLTSGSVCKERTNWFLQRLLLSEVPLSPWLIHCTRHYGWRRSIRVRSAKCCNQFNGNLAYPLSITNCSGLPLSRRKLGRRTFRPLFSIGRRARTGWLSMMQSMMITPL